MFRVIAPDAKTVSVRVGSGFDMTKGPDGIWTVTTTPLVPGFHYYSLRVDGATVAGSSTMTFFGSGWWNSGIEIPEPDSDADYYHAKDVPHGHVGEQSYYSSGGHLSHPAGLRIERKGSLSGSVFAARLGRGRNRLDQTGSC